MNQIGPNNGKRFYCCPRPIDHCSFLQWIEQTPNSTLFNSSPNSTLFNNPTPNSTLFNNSTPNSTLFASHTDQPPAPKCDCGEPCALRTTNKPGPNCGRQFYVCAKPREQQCQFFQWVDEMGTERRGSDREVVCFKCGNKGHMAAQCPQNRFDSRKERQPYKQKPPVSARAPRPARQTRTARKCGLCHKEGHTRKTCPLAKQQSVENANDYQCDYGGDAGDFGLEDMDGAMVWEA